MSEAQAGFDPRAAIDLWQNMAKLAGSSPPAFLSTHPSGEQRMETLNQNLPLALERYREAQAAGRSPACEAPA